MLSYRSFRDDRPQLNRELVGDMRLHGFEPISKFVALAESFGESRITFVELEDAITRPSWPDRVRSGDRRDETENRLVSKN